MVVHVGRGPETTLDTARYVSYDRWGLPDLMIVHVGRGQETTLDTTRYMSLMIDGVA